ncbi:hypothetical protein ACFVY0_40330 [Streptomyces sp. NPDC058286]|uniref:hypothetical protein n=1 Tax=Streptomyces sp. NPDC058286 TaxID=3346422 RepID=UPI0036F01BF5
MLLDAIDDELESIAHHGAEADEELADLTQQAHLDIEELPVEADTPTVPGTVISRSEHPDATQQDGAGGLSRTVLDKNVTSTNNTGARSSVRRVPASSVDSVLARPSRNWLCAHILVGLSVATLWAGFTAGIQQDPGPALWKMFVYGTATLVASLLIWAAILVAASERGGTDTDFLLIVIVPPAAFLAGLVLPWILGTDLWGRWLPDALGVL